MKMVAWLSLYPIYLIEMVFSHCDMAVSHFLLMNEIT